MMRCVRTLGLIVLGAVSLMPGTVATAAETVAFTTGGTTIRLAPIDGFCFLDRANPQHRDAWAVVDRQMTGARVFAAVASCESLNEGGRNGLTAIFSHPPHAQLSTAEIDTQFGFAIGDNVPIHSEEAAFLAESLKDLEPRPGRTVTVAGYAVEGMFIEMREVVGRTQRGRYMMGSTPAPDTIINTMTFDQLADANRVGAFLQLHREILQSVQRNNPRPAPAADIVTIQIGAQQIRLAPPPAVCFLDPQNPMHRPAFDYAQSEASNLVVAAALCDGLETGDVAGLTALFVEPSDIDLTKREIEENIDILMGISDGAPTFANLDSFLAAVVRRFRESDDQDLGRFQDENIFIAVGTDDRRENMYLYGATPLRDTILRTLVLSPVTEREGAAFHLWLQYHLLTSVRAHSASRPIAASN